MEANLLGELLLHLLDDLLSFSKHQISHQVKLEYKEFRLGEIKSQIVSIFEKQARESKIGLEVAFYGQQIDERQHLESLTVPPSAARLPRPARLRDMYVVGDQHRILQVIINLVSNSLKFTAAGGRVQVRMRWGEEIEQNASSPEQLSSTTSRTQSEKTGKVVGFSSSPDVKVTELTPTSKNGTPDTTDFNDKLEAFVLEKSSTPPSPDETTRSYMFTFEIEDTGRGIPEEMQHKIFEPFVQVDSSFSKEFGGTGLGLSICSQLAKLMGGTISVKSTEGLGSTFCLKIPLQHIVDRVPSTVSESTRSRAPSAGGSTKGGAGGSSHRNSLSSVLAQEPVTTATNPIVEKHRSDIQPRLVGLSTPFFPPNPSQNLTRPATPATVITPTCNDEKQAAIQKAKADKSKAAGSERSNDLNVLVADDNPTNIEVVRRMLKLEKVHDVTIARDGREAYELVKAHMERSRMFDLIFMDVQMPNLDGMQSTRLIREMGYGAPIVALTAFSEESNRKACMESGMNEFLAKPIRRAALKSVLTKFATIHEEKD